MASIAKKLKTGALWNSASQVSLNLINVSTTIYVANVLTPTEFGKISIVTLLSAFLSYFCELGLSAYLIRNKDTGTKENSTAFYTSLLASLTVYAFSYFLAPYAAAFYGDPDLTFLIRIVFLTVLLSPVRSVCEPINYRTLCYRPSAISDIVSTLSSAIICVTLANLDYGIYALVSQALTLAISRSIILYWMTPVALSLYFSFSIAKKQLSESLHFTLRNLLIYAMENVDYLLLSKLGTQASLGVYNLSFRLTRFPMQKAWTILGQMVFPAFNLIAQDRDKTVKNYVRITNYAIMILWPVIISIFAFSDNLVPIILGPEWNEASSIIKILCPYFLLRSANLAVESILLCTNKFKRTNLYKLLTLFGFLALATPLTLKNGASGTATAYTIVYSAYCIAILYTLIATYKVKLLELKKLLTRTLAPYIVIIAFTAIPIQSTVGEYLTIALHFVVISASSLFILYRNDTISAKFPFLKLAKT